MAEANMTISVRDLPEIKRLIEAVAELIEERPGDDWLWNDDNMKEIKEAFLAIIQKGESV